MYYISQNEFYHHGVLGMKWGIRRYQPYPPGKEGRFIGEKKEAYRRATKNADTHYKTAIKNVNKSLDKDLSKKERRLEKSKAVYQYGKAREYEKLASKYEKKLKQSGVEVKKDDQQLANQVDAGKYFVKKNLLRRSVEKSSEIISIGMQFAIQSAVLGRPITASVTEYSPYKLNKKYYKELSK